MGNRYQNEIEGHRLRALFLYLLRKPLAGKNQVWLQKVTLENHFLNVLVVTRVYFLNGIYYSYNQKTFINFFFFLNKRVGRWGG